MSYDQALQKMRGQPASVPEFADVAARPKWKPAISTTQWLVALTSVLAAGSFGAVAVSELVAASEQPQFFLAVFTRGPGLASLLPAALLLVAARMVLRTRFTSQMLSRAIWWSNLIVGTLMGFLLGDEIHRFAGIAAALCCGLALLSIDRHGLDSSVEDAAEGTFRPAAFRGLLTLALVMAFADAQTLAFSGILQSNMGGLGWTLMTAFADAGPTLLCAAVMGLAVWGLLRLRTWALFLNLIANFVIAGLAIWGYLGVSSVVAGTLALTAAVQALLPVPILALAAGGPRAERSVFIHHGSKLATLTVLLIMTLAGLGFTQRGFRYTGWLDYQGQTRVRGLNGIRVAPGHEFKGYDMRHRDLAGLSLPHGSDWSDSDVSFTGLQGAYLPDSMWQRTTMVETQFSTANLRGAVFRDLELVDVNLRGADLRGVSFERVTFIGGDMTGARLNSNVFNEVTWQGVTCPDRSSSDHGGMTCAGHSVGNDEEDRFVIGCYHPLPETQAKLDSDPEVRRGLAEMLGVEPGELEESAVLCVDPGAWGNRLLLANTDLLRVRSRKPSPRLREQAEGGDEKVYVNREGPRSLFVLSDERSGLIEIHIGDLELEFARMTRKEP